MTRIERRAPMPVIETRIVVAAPVEVVFDLCRSVELHVDSTGKSREVAVAGRTSGLLGLGDEVTWEATHLGIRQRLTSRITAFDRPRRFRDTMVSGAFARFDHDHVFTPTEAGTLMEDRFDFASPFGRLGRLADHLFLASYMRRFLLARVEAIRRVAESDDAARYLARL